MTRRKAENNNENVLSMVRKSKTVGKERKRREEKRMETDGQRWSWRSEEGCKGSAETGAEIDGIRCF
jgi:hypothetical protein